MGGYPRIVLTEEGMREGMQIESAEIPVADKIRLLDTLSETGLQDIVVGSFVSPKWTPQMAHIEEIVKGFHPKPGVNYHAVALNEQGVERARQFSPPLSLPRRGTATAAHVCDVFAQRNTNRTQAQEIASWPNIVERARQQGVQEAGMVLGAAWGSNWVGPFSHEQRMSLLRRMHRLWTDAGIPVTRVGLLDPMGWNMPDQVEEQLELIKAEWPEIRDVWLHLHDTRGTALASSYMALRTLGAGYTVRLDASIGGMAGCPYCGNGRAAALVATEDLVNFLEELGIPTGVDLDKLIEVVWMAEEVVGHPLYGHVSKAGPRPHYDRLYRMDMPFVETLDEARHFLRGPAVYEGAMSPWKAPIRSWQRPESAAAAPDGHGPSAGGNGSGPAGDGAAAAGNGATAGRPAPAARE
jgi:hydroxymethylglutaryl-CoA lyase